MALSGSYDFVATRDDIIKAALRKVTQLSDHETPTSSQTTTAALGLNSIIKAYMTIGMPVWTMKKQVINCSDLSTGIVQIGLGKTVNIPKPQKIAQVMLMVDGMGRELFQSDRQTFYSYALQESEGAPNTVYYQPMLNYGELSVYPIPDDYHQDNATIELHHQTMLQDVDSATHDIDFPVEWTLLMIYELAVFLAPDAGLPIAERQLLMQERDRLKKESENFDIDEGSVLLQP